MTNLSAFWSYCEGFVEERKRDLRGDLTSALLRERTGDPDGLDDREIASIVFALSFAGHETTTNLIGNALRQLLSHPGIWAELSSTPTLIAGAVEETLRIDSSVIAWRRITKRETEIGGVRVPKGAKLMLSLGAANHDPRHFPDPKVFDPRRADARSHLSFGKGTHFCLGQHLARIEVTIVLELLIRRFPDLHLAANQSATFPPNISFRGPNELWAEWNATA